jgi:hypothetical protein
MLSYFVERLRIICNRSGKYPVRAWECFLYTGSEYFIKLLFYLRTFLSFFLSLFRFFFRSSPRSKFNNLLWNLLLLEPSQIFVCCYCCFCLSVHISTYNNSRIVERTEVVSGTGDSYKTACKFNIFQADENQYSLRSSTIFLCASRP